MTMIRRTAMLSRRALMAAGAGQILAAGSLATGPARAAAVMTDDGYYREDWFLDSFLELADDRKNAAAAGKQLAVIWEQRGCPYCRDMHLINFADRSIDNYVRAHFDMLELDLHGSRIVTDFDGEQLGERQLAAKYGVRGTPAIQFFPDGGDLASKPPQDREVHRIRGYLPPKWFLAMFTFAGEHAYERGSLRDFLRQQS
jgi:thioredoxin-related protein